MKIAAHIEIEGIKPILINTFPLDTLTSNKSKTGTAGNNQTEWEKTVLMTHDRQLFVHNTYLIGAITSAGKMIKSGKSTIHKKVGSSLEIVEPQLLLIGLQVPTPEEISNDSTQPVYLDVRAVVNPMTKGRNVRYRVAARPGWKLQATISWDDKAVSKEDMRICVENAGLFEGIGDGRKIGFGRFKMNHFKMEK